MARVIIKDRTNELKTAKRVDNLIREPKKLKDFKLNLKNIPPFSVSR